MGASPTRPCARWQVVYFISLVLLLLLCVLLTWLIPQWFTPH